LRGYIGFVIVGALVIATEHSCNEIGVTRLFGLLFLCFCVYGSFAISRKYRGRPAGWKKAIVIVPIATIGLVLVLYAPAITCASVKYKHLCA
jgi:hypothetical protein